MPYIVNGPDAPPPEHATAADVELIHTLLNVVNPPHVVVLVVVVVGNVYDCDAVHGDCSLGVVHCCAMRMYTVPDVNPVSTLLGEVQSIDSPNAGDHVALSLDHCTFMPSELLSPEAVNDTLNVPPDT